MHTQRNFIFIRSPAKLHRSGLSVNLTEVCAEGGDSVIRELNHSSVERGRCIAPLTTHFDKRSITAMAGVLA
jgi:hypothetical protein